MAGCGARRQLRPRTDGARRTSEDHVAWLTSHWHSTSRSGAVRHRGRLRSLVPPPFPSTLAPVSGPGSISGHRTLSAHWTPLLRGLLSHPGDDAVHVERVIALSHDWVLRVSMQLGRQDHGRGRTQRAFLARITTLGAGAVVGIAADAAHVVLGHVPAPCRHRRPLLDADLHRGRVCLSTAGHWLRHERQEEEGERAGKDPVSLLLKRRVGGRDQGDTDSECANMPGDSFVWQSAAAL